MNQGGKQQMHH